MRLIGERGLAHTWLVGGGDLGVRLHDEREKVAPEQPVD